MHSTANTSRGGISNSSHVNIAIPLLVQTREAAQILGLSPSTLEKWRFHRTPNTPPVVRIGRACRYRLADLRDWVERQGEITAPSEKPENAS